MGKFGAWHKVASQSEADNLLAQFQYFHDAILRESKFSLGAFVDEGLALQMVHKPHLRVLFQRQKSEPAAIEVFFVGVERVQLLASPHDAIEEASITVSEDGLVWADSFGTTTISAELAYWRSVDDWIGQRERYTAVVPEDLDYYLPEQECELPCQEVRGRGNRL